MKIVSLQHVLEAGVSHNPEIKKRVMLGDDVVPHLTNFSQAYFAPGQAADAHAHPDMAEVYFIDKGTGHITIDSAQYPLRPGTCVVIEPGEIHEVVNTSTENLVITYFGIKV